MKKLCFAVLTVGLFASLTAFGQQAGHQKVAPAASSRRVISIVGRASDDGSIVLRNSDGKVWVISNPDTLKGHKGLPVVIQGQSVPGKKNEIQVLSVSAGKSEVEYLTKWDDSAFRR